MSSGFTKSSALNPFFIHEKYASINVVLNTGVLDYIKAGIMIDFHIMA